MSLLLLFLLLESAKLSISYVVAIVVTCLQSMIFGQFWFFIHFWNCLKATWFGDCPLLLLRLPVLLQLLLRRLGVLVLRRLFCLFWLGERPRWVRPRCVLLLLLRGPAVSLLRVGGFLRRNTSRAQVTEARISASCLFNWVVAFAASFFTMRVIISVRRCRPVGSCSYKFDKDLYKAWPSDSLRSASRRRPAACSFIVSQAWNLCSSPRRVVMSRSLGRKWGGVGAVPTAQAGVRPCWAHCLSFPALILIFPSATKQARAWRQIPWAWGRIEKSGTLTSVSCKVSVCLEVWVASVVAVGLLLM